MSVKRSRKGERHNVKRVFADYTLAKKDMGEYNSIDPMSVAEARAVEADFAGPKFIERFLQKKINEAQ